MKTMMMLFISTCLFFTGLFAQESERISLKGKEVPDFLSKEMYKYPAFIKGKIYFKDGDSGQARINYNYMLNTVQFINEKKDTMAIVNEKDIQLVLASTDSLFYNEGYYEWMASSSNIRLSAKPTLKLVGHNKIGTYGIPSPNFHVESMADFVGHNNYALTPDEEFVFLKKKNYYISHKAKNDFTEINKKNLLKFFPNKKDKIEDYIKEKNTNFSKEEDLVDLFFFLNS